MSDTPSTNTNKEVPPDQSTWSEDEKKAFSKYGRLPKQSHLLAKKDKKYFDSADWAKGANTTNKQALPPNLKPPLNSTTSPGKE
eukprot:TRINITY_DN31634_c0_g1_i1.p1 TRINITY_DN31634_c0_g1~~TRINITY_DN31634_c0_g1_i1.p1  ORF type:complete len:84 (-),score=30.21 TRINITY_DN31634_c0_g1_i1:101-352(-)